METSPPPIIQGCPRSLGTVWGVGCWGGISRDSVSRFAISRHPDQGTHPLEETLSRLSWARLPFPVVEALGGWMKTGHRCCVLKDPHMPDNSVSRPQSAAALQARLSCRDSSQLKGRAEGSALETAAAGDTGHQRHRLALAATCRWAGSGGALPSPSTTVPQQLGDRIPVRC